MNRDEIKQLLIEACEKGDASIFKPALVYKELKSGFKNNEEFYRFFEETINNAHYDLDEKLYLKTTTRDTVNHSYEFFSKVHVYSRLCIHVKETIDSLEIDLMPF